MLICVLIYASNQAERCHPGHILLQKCTHFRVRHTVYSPFESKTVDIQTAAKQPGMN
jgi:hypothetical protein